MFARLSLNQKFVLVLTPMTLILAVVAAMSWDFARRGTKDIRVLQRSEALALKSGMLAVTMSDSLRAYLLAPKEEKWYARKKQADEDLTKALAELNDILPDQGLLQYVKQMREIDEKEQDPAENKILDMVKAGKLREAQESFVKEYTPIHENWDALAQKFVGLVVKSVEEKTVELEAGMARTVRFVFLGVLVGVISSIALLFMVFRVSRRLSEVSKHIDSSSSKVALTSQELAGSNQDLSSNAAASAASLEETVSSIEEISSMVRVNSENASQAAALSQSSTKAAESGEEAMKRLVTAVGDVAKSSREIESIITVIDDIAFQTNLLALNAAVEAARAGEQGRGFAVVADAVRSLAQRSADAAKDITRLIKTSVDKTATGEKLADESGSALREIVALAKKVSDLNNEIASASQAQATGLAQVSKAMAQLDQATQSNALSAESAAASSEEMRAQADILSNMVNELSRTINGERHGGKTEAAQAVTPAPKSAKVVPIESGSRTQAVASELIPFEDDEEKKSQVAR